MIDFDDAIYRVPMERPAYLTRAQQQAIDDYRLSDNAVAINSALRIGMPLTEIQDDYDEGYGYYQALHETLLELAGECSLKEELVVYRGVSLPRLPAKEEHILEGWSSVSLRVEVARWFSQDTTNDGRTAHPYRVIMRMVLPRGTHLIDTLQADVAELILPPGTLLKTTSVATNTEPESTFVSVYTEGRVIGQEGQKIPFAPEAVWVGVTYDVHYATWS